MLPIDIASVDESRGFGCIESLDNNTAEEEAEFWVDYVLNDVGNDYTPYSFWESQECYCQMLVEKIDLRKLFEPICNKLKIPIANAKGWPDIHMRAAMMQRYKFWEGKGKRPVLLYCGDFDPVGLQISDSYRNMFTDISGAVGWHPDSLIIDRFGLNYDFIQSAGLSWIENLITGNTNEEKDLADPRHKDHNKPHVQDYIKAYGARKVEANAIVVVPEMGRKLCREAIEKYVSEDAPDEYVENLTDIRQDVTNQIKSILKERLNAE
jgi:hypothetical protein